MEKLELRVREGNTEALRLYQQFGFVEEGRFEKRIKLADGSCLADISMAKILRPLNLDGQWDKRFA
jgi:putative acetyltransferase